MTRGAGPFAGAAGIALSLAAAAHAQQPQPGSAPAGSPEATAPQANRWVQVGGSTDRYEEYLDQESVRRTGRQVTLWTRREFVRDQATEWNELEFDCSAKTQTVLAYIRDDRGVISHNIVRPHRNASPVPAGSVEETILNLACR